MDMKRLVLTEKQIKKIIDNVINEQFAGEISVGTDGSKISHKALSSFGLPQSKSDNIYYSSDTASIVKQSSGSENQFLSIFKPLNDSKTYTDYLQVGDTILNNQGSKVFNFSGNQNVVASHNGLLSIVRAMRQFKGSPYMTTVNFGKSNTKTKEGQTERETKVVQINWAEALNPNLGGLDMPWIGLAVRIPQYCRKGYIESVQWAQKNGVKGFIDSYTKLLCGLTYGGYADQTRIDEIMNVLPKEGFVTKFEYDLQPMYDALSQLRSESDYEGGDDGNRADNEKAQKVQDTFFNYYGPLKDYLIKTYRNNLYVYVKHYLPNSYTQFVNQINSIDEKKVFPASEWYLRVVNKTDKMSYGTGGPAPNASVTQQTVNNKTGN
jgi:hypothetical protein